MIQRLYLSVLICLFSTLAFAQIQTPSDFLPHQLGATFTPHHLLVDYFQYLADNSPNIQLIEYGRTNEDRPLLLAFISTPDNLAKLEALQQNQLRSAGLVDGQPDAALDRAFVWLSFSVHGNEAAGSEASMAVAYDLANPLNVKTQTWLENTIVIIDPSLNPDGYSRYTHWYRGVTTTHRDINPNAREHREPWPGGRTNHYMFDLNRDWAWQTQVESEQRMVQYLQWMPHIHADLHEQYFQNPYYFAPAAQPYHSYITEWQADFQTEIGKNHARYFDENGWLYFTREVFDLLYPSYGDTYPTFNGSIGMTYEQGGHSRGGSAILLPNHDTLTLYDRIEHHRTTALSTVEMGSKNKSRLVDQFQQYFKRSASNPFGPYKTYIISGDNPQPRLQALIELFDKNGIEYGHLAKGSSLDCYDYQTHRRHSVKVDSRDLIVSAYQPRSVLVQALLDPTTEVVDSLTYDITAWSLPYAYGLEAYASTARAELTQGFNLAPYSNNLGENPKPYAYLVPWESMAEVTFLSQLLKAGIKVRNANSEFSLNGSTYAPGTLVITRADNRKNSNLDAIVRSHARAAQVRIKAVNTGFTQEGPNFGSGSMTLVQAPRIAMIAGENTYSNETGQVWYYFEQRLDYPIHMLYPDDLEDWSGDEIDILILPEGRYSMSDGIAQQLSTWVRDGGKLIAVGAALSGLSSDNGFGLSRKSYQSGDDEPTFQDHTYAGAERRSIADFNPGAIFSVNLDNTHPLGFGFNETYYSLKTGSSSYEHLSDGWSVGTLDNDPHIIGFVGHNAKQRLKNTLVFGVQEMGSGNVVYLVDNPLYRGFWEQGNFLFANALFMVGNTD